MRAAAAVMMATAALLGACADTGTWQNPNVPHEQWAQDKADCQRRARNQAEREFAITEQSSQSVMSGGVSGGPASPNSQWQSDMNRFSAQKRETRLFENCMTAKGYTLVTESTSEEDTDGSEPASPDTPEDQHAPPAPAE